MRFLLLPSGSGCSTSSISSRARSGPRIGPGTCTRRRSTAALITTCRASYAGLRPISAYTTSIIVVAESHTTGCPTCCANTLSLLLQVDSRSSKAFAACASCFGTRTGGGSFRSVTWAVVTSVIAKSVRTITDRTTHGERLAHPGPMTGAFSQYCNSEHTLAGSGADAPRPARRCGPRTRHARHSQPQVG